MWVAILDIVRTNVPNTLNCAATDLICHHHHRLSTPARCHFACRMSAAILDDVCMCLHRAARRGDPCGASIIILTFVTASHLLVSASVVAFLFHCLCMYVGSVVVLSMMHT